MRLARALVAVAVLSVGALPLDALPVGALAVPARSAAWHDGPCEPSDNVGVTVVVDFRELGGGVNVRCTGGAVADGADALDSAGISWQGTLRWGRGFVCKIAGKPANDPCVDTPPASAYWSYWIAPRGGSWCYSNVGLLNRTPPPGSVEGWSFSLDDRAGSSLPPAYAPPKLAAGLRPNPLAAGDCDPGGGVVDTVPSTGRPSTPTTRPGGSGASGGPGLDGRPGVTTLGGLPHPDASTTAQRTTTTAPATTSTTKSEADEGDEGDEGEARDGADDGSGDGDRQGVAGDESAAPPSQNQVDLGRDGTEQDGVPPSTIVGLALVAAVTGGAIRSRRRRRRLAASAE